MEGKSKGERDVDRMAEDGRRETEHEARGGGGGAGGGLTWNTEAALQGRPGRLLEHQPTLR